MRGPPARFLGAGAAAVVLVAALTGSAPSGAVDDRPVLAVRDEAGTLLARVPLADNGRFALAYRNSLYGSTAEERFSVQRGQLALVELAADELAVLEEYYAADGVTRRAPASDRREWLQRLANPSALDELRLAATDLGQRTLIAGAHRVELWRLVSDSTGASVTIGLEQDE